MGCEVAGGVSFSEDECGKNTLELGLKIGGG